MSEKQDYGFRGCVFYAPHTIHVHNEGLPTTVRSIYDAIVTDTEHFRKCAILSADVSKEAAALILSVLSADCEIEL